jgi:hypothetical protein
MNYFVYDKLYLQHDCWAIGFSSSAFFADMYRCSAMKFIISYTFLIT